MSKFSSCRAAIVASMLAIAAPATLASVVLNGTRVIYPEAEPETTLKLTNDSEVPALVQAWIDDGNLNATPEDTKTPFMLAPPLFRLDGKKGQTLRIVYLGDALPRDRESLFWLNVLEVPPMAADDGGAAANSLQLAFRSRIKLMFRPKDLPGDAGAAPFSVTWRLARKDDGKQVLKATNPTAYHVTFTTVEATAQGHTFSNDAGAMAAPGETIEFPIGDTPAVSGEPDTVRFTTIDDYGAAVPGIRRRGNDLSTVAP